MATKYVNGELVYWEDPMDGVPSPVEPSVPTEQDLINAQILYTALLTGTYIGGENNA